MHPLKVWLTNDTTRVALVLCVPVDAYGTQSPLRVGRHEQQQCQRQHVMSFFTPTRDDDHYDTWRTWWMSVCVWCVMIYYLIRNRALGQSASLHYAAGGGGSTPWVDEWISFNWGNVEVNADVNSSIYAPGCECVVMYDRCSKGIRCAWCWLCNHWNTRTKINRRRIEF